MHLLTFRSLGAPSCWQDEDRLKSAANEAPTHPWINEKLARSKAEIELFDKLDREHPWPGGGGGGHQGGGSWAVGSTLGQVGGGRADIKAGRGGGSWAVGSTLGQVGGKRTSRDWVLGC